MTVSRRAATRRLKAVRIDSPRPARRSVSGRPGPVPGRHDKRPSDAQILTTMVTQYLSGEVKGQLEGQKLAWNQMAIFCLDKARELEKTTPSPTPPKSFPYPEVA